MRLLSLARAPCLPYAGSPPACVGVRLAKSWEREETPMPHPYYRASVEVFQARLDALSYYFDKGAEFGAAREMTDKQFLGARLYPNMLPLVDQIRIATDHAKGGAGRLAGVELPVFEDEETTVADVTERIAKAMAFLDTLTPEQFEGVETRTVVMKLGPETHEFAAPAYLHHFALPNFYFHQVTAYDILRAMGVPVGKRDYFGQKLIKE
jgi:hypothetical protein